MDLQRLQYLCQGHFPKGHQCSKDGAASIEAAKKQLSPFLIKKKNSYYDFLQLMNQCRDILVPSPSSSATAGSSYFFYKYDIVTRDGICMYGSILDCNTTKSWIDW
jgi:hypothetical protein